MDEISRDLPPDTTSARGTAPRGKGPEELLAFERNRISGEAVVSEGSRFSVPEPDPELPQEPLPEPPPPASEPAAEAESVDAEIAEVADAVPEIDAAAAAAALVAEAEVAEIEEEVLGDEEGLPAVPELADAAAVAKVVFVLMLSSREGLSVFRLAQACNTTQKLVEEALALLQEDLRNLGLPVELARTGDTVKWLSGPDTFPYLQRLRGVKKLEKLSPAALETLAVIAYRQPVMRGEIEAIRGVKAGPMLRTLLQHKLVRVTGRADVPGRPLQYGTTPQFLERFGLGSLQELPSIKEWKNLG